MDGVETHTPDGLYNHEALPASLMNFDALPWVIDEFAGHPQAPFWLLAEYRNQILFYFRRNFTLPDAFLEFAPLQLNDDDGKPNPRYLAIFDFFYTSDLITANPKYAPAVADFKRDFERDPAAAITDRGLLTEAYLFRQVYTGASAYWIYWANVYDDEQMLRIFLMSLLGPVMDEILEFYKEFSEKDRAHLISSNLFYHLLWIHFTVLQAFQVDETHLEFIDAAEIILLELSKGQAASLIKYGWSLTAHDLIFDELIRQAYPVYLGQVEPEPDDSTADDEPDQSDPSIFIWDDADELVSDLGPPEYLIDNYFEKDSVAQMFGDYGSYKTFVAVSIACSVSTGRSWMGKSVQQGPVFYLLGEGRGGMKRRLAAWQKHYGVKSFDRMLKMSRRPAQLTAKESALSVMKSLELLKKTIGPPALIVIDTLNRNFGPGNENSTEDMTSFVSHLDAYLRGDSNVLIVHHTGHKEKTRARGSSALVAAVDTEYRIDADRPLHCSMVNTKMKDSEPPVQVNLLMKSVELGLWGGTQPVTSLVATLESTGKPAEKPNLTGNYLTAYDELVSLFRIKRLRLSNSGHLPRDAKVLVKEWRDACVVETNQLSTEQFSRCKRGLVDKNMIVVSDNNAVEIIYTEDLKEDVILDVCGV